MRKFTVALSLFYLLIFVFVKAQEVSVSATDLSVPVVKDGATQITGLGFFVMALFVVSIISFAVFWIYKDYLFAALRGELGQENRAELNMNDTVEMRENIGENEAKLISEVDVYDVTEDNTEQEENEIKERSKPEMYVENVSGEPRLVIK